MRPIQKETIYTPTVDKGMNANCLKTVLNVQTYWPHSLKHDVTKNDDHKRDEEL